MAQSAQEQGTGLAIVGGGITGLSAALRAIENGADPRSITIYEASERTGGKIRTAHMQDGTPVNMGAEFIDSDHTGMIALAGKLGVKLVDANNLDNESFQKPGGGTMSGQEFYSKFEPIAAQVRRHKAIVERDPNGTLARQLDAMSLEDYMASLRQHTPAEAAPSLFRKFLNFVTGQDNRVSPMLTSMAVQSFASEVGQPPSSVNALSYLHEASAEKGALLASDCAYRVDGGMERITQAMEQRLAAAGVRFEKNARISAVAPQGDRKLLHFSDGRAPVAADKMLLALPAYALGKIDGLEQFGMPAQARQLIGGAQYTNSVKFTVKLNPGMKGVKGNFFANHGMQVWSAGEGQMTFLVNADKLDRMSVPQLIAACKQSYAKSNGVSADALFASGPGNVLFDNPGASPCYASAKPGEARALQALTPALDGMHAHGVGVAGTYLSMPGKPGVGFMECGVTSAERAIDQLVAPQKQRSATLEHILSHGPKQSQLGHAAALQGQGMAAAAR